MGFILMAGGSFRVSFTQLVSQLEQSEREILKLCLSLDYLRGTVWENDWSSKQNAGLLYGPSSLMN